MKDRLLDQFQIQYRHQRQGSAELWVLALLMVLFVGSLLQVNLGSRHPLLDEVRPEVTDHLGVGPVPFLEERLPQSPAVGY